MSVVPRSPQQSWLGPAMQRIRLTPIDLALATATVVSADVVAWHLVPQPVHGLLALGVLVGAPAAAMARALRLADALAAFVTGVAFAMAVLLAISTLLLYLQRWSETNVLVLMTSVTLGLAVASSRLRRP